MCAGRCPVKERLGAQIHDNEGQGEVSHKIDVANPDSFNPDLVHKPRVFTFRNWKMKILLENIQIASISVADP